MGKLKAQQQNSEADALFLSIGDGAITTDQNGNISRVNDVALQIIGKGGQNIIGSWFPGTFIATDEEGRPIPLINRAITRCMMNGKSISERTFYKHDSGKIIPVFVTVSPIMISGRPVGAVEVFRDISAEYEVEQIKSEFISIASHQLRTPATAVKNFIGLMREGFAGDLTKEQRELVNQAYISNEHQLDIVNNLLYVARADSREVNLKISTNDLTQLVRNCVEEQKQVLDARKQKITIKCPGELFMTFDRQFIHMLIENLVSNASKYTPDGGKIHVSLKDDKDHAVLSVKDTGVGISAEDQQRLFKRFMRIENDLSTIRGGSGIGLHLVKRVVDLHDGAIMVHSELGKGTTFTVRLPKEVSSG